MSPRKTEETMSGWKSDPASVTIRTNDIDPGDLAKIMKAYATVSAADCGIALDAAGAPIKDANGASVVLLAVAVPTSAEYDG